MCLLCALLSFLLFSHCVFTSIAFGVNYLTHQNALNILESQRTIELYLSFVNTLVQNTCFTTWSYVCCRTIYILHSFAMHIFSRFVVVGRWFRLVRIQLHTKKKQKCDRRPFNKRWPPSRIDPNPVYRCHRNVRPSWIAVQIGIAMTQVSADHAQRRHQTSHSTVSTSPREFFFNQFMFSLILKWWNCLMLAYLF